MINLGIADNANTSTSTNVIIIHPPPTHTQTTNASLSAYASASNANARANNANACADASNAGTQCVMRTERDMMDRVEAQMFATMYLKYANIILPVDLELIMNPVLSSQRVQSYLYFI